MHFRSQIVYLIGQNLELPRNPKNHPESSSNPAQVEPNYPVQIRIRKVDFIKMVSEAKRSKDFSRVRDFYSEAFKSPGDCRHILVTELKCCIFGNRIKFW